MTMTRNWLLLLAGGVLWPAAGCYSLTPPVVNPPLSANNTAPAPGAPGGQALSLKAEFSPGEHAKICFTTAESLEQGGKPVEAIGLYEKARQADPKLHQATRRLAVLYDQVGQFDKAVEEYQKAIKQFPKDPDLYNDLGYGYYCRGEWAEAEKSLRKALELNPKHERALMNLGMALGQQQRYQEALAYFERAVSP